MKGGVFMLTSEMVASVGDSITADIGVILPVAIGIFAAIFGITLLFKLINKSKRA